MTTLGDVRILIPDLGTPPEFSDLQITALLLLNGDDVYLAAADALDVLITDMAMNGGTVRTDDLTISDKDSMDAMVRRVIRLREQSAFLADDSYQLVYTFGQRTYPEQYICPEGIDPRWFRIDPRWF